MTNLVKKLIALDYAENVEKASEIQKAMKAEMAFGQREAEEILADYGLDEEDVFDLMQ